MRFQGEHLFPIVVGRGRAHAPTQQLKRLRFIEYSREKGTLLTQGACCAVIAVDQRHTAPGWKSDHDSVAGIRWNVIDVAIEYPRMFEPPQRQGGWVDADEVM